MGVKIEVFRMMLYLSFPVTMFWISNQAEYFEEYIVKRKIVRLALIQLFLPAMVILLDVQREIFPPDEQIQRKELEDFKERMRRRREKRLLNEVAMPSEN